MVKPDHAQLEYKAAQLAGLFTEKYVAPSFFVSIVQYTLCKLNILLRQVLAKGVRTRLNMA